MQLNKDLIEDIKLIARNIVYLHTHGELRDGELPIIYLKAFGISSSGREQLKKIQFFYEKKDLPDNAIAKYLKVFFENSNLDFFIYHTLLKYIIQYRVLRRYPL